MTERQQDAPGESQADGPQPPSEASGATEGNPTELEADVADEAGIGAAAIAADETETADEAAVAAEADEAVAVDEATETEPGRGTAPVVAPPTPSRRERGRPMRPTPTSGPTRSEQAVRIDDRVSQAFVLVTVAVFVLIFANAILLGRGGVFAAPSPSPSETVESASPSLSPGTSGSPSASGSSSPGASTSPGTSGSPGGSVAPSPSS